MKLFRIIKNAPLSSLFRMSKTLLRKKVFKMGRVTLEKELQQGTIVAPKFPAAILRSWMTGSKETADRICNHEFDILGLGPKHLGKEINWQNPAGPIKHDVKIPWELSRFQFLPTLIKAYEVHHDELYSEKAKNLIHDWILKNPLGKGIHWECAMEVAIRACNFSLAWFFLKNTPETLLTSIAEHGKFIYRHLEYGPGYTSNHLISNAAGLLFLGILFPQFREAKAWKRKGIALLEQEMERQVYEDGVDYEGSIPYHGLVCELFGMSAMIANTNGVYFSPAFRQRLEKMFEFAWRYTKPNGRAPQIGDSDDGRLFIFEDYFSWERRDQSRLMQIAAALFPENLQFNMQDVEKSSKGFNFGGIYIMRKKDFYCIVDCGLNGQNGNSGHAHNDTLSFELSAGGEDFIVDPGTYAYTADPVERNRFRGTAMHNTVMIDNQEMNRFAQGEVFHMKNDAIRTVNKWDSREDYDLLDAQHSGYERLSSPVTHRRTFRFDKKNLSLEIKDYFIGKGTHTLQFNFHFAPGVKLKKSEKKIFAEKNGVLLELHLPEELLKHASIHEGEVSPRYGVKEKAEVLTMIEKGGAFNQPYAFVFKII